MHTFSGEILIVLGLASILYLTFEAPFLLIEDYFYKKRNAKNEVKRVEVREVNVGEDEIKGKIEN